MAPSPFQEIKMAATKPKKDDKKEEEKPAKAKAKPKKDKE